MVEDKLLLEQTVEDYLATPYSECEYTKRDFGAVVKKPNYFLRPPFKLELGDLKLDHSKHYVFSEMILALNPSASTPAMSHEGEVYEIIEVRGPGHIMYTDNCQQASFFPCQIFFAVNSNSKDASGNPKGFYHKLTNCSTSEPSLARILTIAEKQLAIKEGKPMKYGFNRPPNSYLGAK